jgi:hypothetical protein
VGAGYSQGLSTEGFRELCFGLDSMFDWGGQFFRGLREKDQSIASGLLIGLILWTLTHLVDSVTSNGSIEYAVTYSK